jgi:hypothetical protein
MISDNADLTFYETEEHRREKLKEKSTATLSIVAALYALHCFLRSLHHYLERIRSDRARIYTGILRVRIHSPFDCIHRYPFEQLGSVHVKAFISMP